MSNKETTSMDTSLKLIFSVEEQESHAAISDHYSDDFELHYSGDKEVLDIPEKQANETFIVAVKGGGTNEFELPKGNILEESNLKANTTFVVSTNDGDSHGLEVSKSHNLEEVNTISEKSQKAANETFVMSIKGDDEKGDLPKGNNETTKISDINQDEVRAVTDNDKQELSKGNYETTKVSENNQVKDKKVTSGEKTSKKAAKRKIPEEVGKMTTTETAEVPEICTRSLRKRGNDSEKKSDLKTSNGQLDITVKPGTTRNKRGVSQDSEMQQINKHGLGIKNKIPETNQQRNLRRMNKIPERGQTNQKEASETYGDSMKGGDNDKLEQPNSNNKTTKVSENTQDEAKAGTTGRKTSKKAAKIKVPEDVDEMTSTETTEVPEKRTRSSCKKGNGSENKSDLATSDDQHDITVKPSITRKRRGVSKESKSDLATSSDQPDITVKPGITRNRKGIIKESKIPRMNKQASELKIKEKSPEKNVQRSLKHTIEKDEYKKGQTSKVPVSTKRSNVKDLKEHVSKEKRTTGKGLVTTRTLVRGKSEVQPEQGKKAKTEARNMVPARKTRTRVHFEHCTS